MKSEKLTDIVKKNYPHIINSLKISLDQEDETGEIKFHNPRYFLWFTEEPEQNYIVGINFLHNHFDSEDKEANLRETLEYIDEVITDQIVAIGQTSKDKNFIIATMDKEEGIKYYSNEKPKIEIVSFSKEY